MKYLLPLLLLAGCVSSHLAESNLRSVTSLAEAAVQVSPEMQNEGQEAIDNADALVEATDTFQQIIHFGVPSDLVDENTKHVDTLASVVDPSKPEVKVVVNKAKENAADLSGQVYRGKQLIATTMGIPYFGDIEKILTLIGSTVGLVYAGTRGRKHVANWWATPSKKIPPSPAPLPTDNKVVS